MEECLLPQELNKLTASSGRFLVHLGDIQDGKINSCPESLHIGISRIFEASPVPVFFVIGDNGWLDCDNFDESYSYWEKVGQMGCYFFCKSAPNVLGNFHSIYSRIIQEPT